MSQDAPENGNRNVVVSELDAEDRRNSRSHLLGFAVAVMITVLILSALLLGFKKGDILFELFKSLALLAGGFGGGFGVSELRRRL